MPKKSKAPTKKKGPKKLTYEFRIATDQGFAALALSLQAPEGYVFESMERKNTKAKITYRRVEDPSE